MLAAMLTRTPALAAFVAVGASACGLTSRHTVGPTVDSNGQFGLMFSSAIGPVLGCDRKIAVPVRVGAGVISEDPPGPRSDGAGMALDVGVGVDWLLATPHSGRRFAPAADLGPQSPEDAKDAGWQMGKRVGLRTSFSRMGEIDAWALGVSGTLVLPMARNLFSLGVEGGCDVFLTSSGDDAPWFRCDLGLAFDLTNRHAVDGPVL